MRIYCWTDLLDFSYMHGSPKSTPVQNYRIRWSLPDYWGLRRRYCHSGRLYCYWLRKIWTSAFSKLRLNEILPDNNKQIIIGNK